MNKTNLPNNLYEIRRGAGLSQEEFAEKLGVSRQAVSKWERGEAYPDTENLIVISEMFGVTIDELLKSENIGSDTKGEKAEENSDEEPVDGSFRVKVGDKVNLNLSGEITVDDDETKVKIDLDKGDILVDDEDGQVKVNLGKSGIVVNSDDGVKVKLGKGGIVINEDDDDDDFDDDDEEDKARKASKLSILYKIPYPIVATIAFLAIGLLADGWYWAWTLFMTIPLYYSLLDSIRKKRFTEFAYPVFTAFLYCLFGMLFTWWHPGWLIFVTIPVYYPIAEGIDRYIRNKNN
ncbi:MAG: helix-turn-helix transcriptional regulator [Clostridia bacterium]|nr:helix-turn-helix transcriptional regulator [Clostridia bacterium]